MTGPPDDGQGSDSLSNSDGTTRSQKIHPPDLSVWDWSGRGNHVDFLKDDRVPLQEGRQLGRGKNGLVYETESRGVMLAWKQRFCRYKITKKELQEMEILKKLDHKHVVMLVGTYTHRHILGILLWPVAVCDLQTFFDDLEILRHPQSALEDNRDAISERMEVLNLRTYKDGCERVLQFPGCLANAVEYLHSQKIRHKDLKPMNILLSRDGLWLTDFDISTDFSHLSCSSTENGARGTPNYFAPEVAKYEKNGRAADVFSLGCVFLEIFTVGFGGRLEDLQLLRPVRGQSFQENLESIDSWLSYIESLPEAEEHHLTINEQDTSNRMTLQDKSVLKLEHSLIRTLIQRMLSSDAPDRPTIAETVEMLRDSVMLGHNPNRLKARFYGSCCAPIEGCREPERSEDVYSVAQEDNHGGRPSAKVVNSRDTIIGMDSTLEDKPVIYGPHPGRGGLLETGEVATPIKKASSRRGSRGALTFDVPGLTLDDVEKAHEDLTKISKMRERSGGDGHDGGAWILVDEGKSRHADEESVSSSEPNQPLLSHPSYVRVTQQADLRGYTAFDPSTTNGSNTNGSNTNGQVQERQMRRLGQGEMLYETYMYPDTDLANRARQFPTSYSSQYSPQVPSRQPNWPQAVPPAASNITDFGLAQLGIRACGILRASGNTRTLDSRFRKRDARFFRVGKVFSVLWPELAGDNNTSVTIGSGRLHEKIAHMIRWFIVVRGGNKYCTCLTINTYTGRGVAMRGLTKHEHAVIYTSKSPPSPTASEIPRPGEQGMLKPIRVVRLPNGPHLDQTARVNFARVYTVESNVKVFEFGVVAPEHLALLEAQFYLVLGVPQLRTTVKEDQDNENDEDNDEDEEDEETDEEDDEEDEDDEGEE